jgi:hypothetical protein
MATSDLDIAVHELSDLPGWLERDYPGTGERLAAALSLVLSSLEEQRAENERLREEVRKHREHLQLHIELDPTKRKGGAP